MDDLYDRDYYQKWEHYQAGTYRTMSLKEKMDFFDGVHRQEIPQRLMWDERFPFFKEAALKLGKEDRCFLCDILEKQDYNEEDQAKAEELKHLLKNQET